MPEPLTDADVFPALTPEQASSIAIASIAAAGGDLAPAAAWLRRFACTVTATEDGDFSWTGGPGVPGGFAAGLDPVGICVMICLGTMGTLWPFLGGKAALDETKRLWRKGAAS